MSVNLGPKGQPVVDIHSTTTTEPELTFFEKVWNFGEEGRQMDTMPCKNYCLNKWNKEKEDLPSQIFEKIMKNCQKECEEYKRFAHRDRCNF